MNITCQDIVDSGACVRGAVQFFKSYGMKNSEISDFIDFGMPIDEFKSRFGHDALAQNVIKFVESK